MTKVTVKQDRNGELYIELPFELTQGLGWDEETEAMWIVEDDGTITIRKKEEDDSSNET